MAKAKFKVGDTVKVVNQTLWSNVFPIGRTFVIQDVQEYESDDIDNVYRADPDGYGVHEPHLELCPADPTDSFKQALATYRAAGFDVKVTVTKTVTEEL